MSILNEVDVVKAAWDQSSYYSDAEKWTFLFWNDGTVFRRLFDMMELSSVIELACGHGRHAEMIYDKCEDLTLIDVFESNLDYCQSRLSKNNVKYILGSGIGFTPVRSNSTTAIFCYDAMVHFSVNIVDAYIKDAARVLKAGGTALFHHSNYRGPELAHYGEHPHARNVSNFDSIVKSANESGLEVVESVVIDWGGVPDLDRVTLFRKS